MTSQLALPKRNFLLDHSAQAKAATGFDKTAFVIDWKARQVRCPAGKTSAHWNPVK